VQNLSAGINQLNEMNEEHILNEHAVSQHRTLDPFSGRWNECCFSADICQTLLSKTNGILKNNGVQQQVGMKQLNNPSNNIDTCSNIADWWNGPKTETLISSSDTVLHNLDIHDTLHQAISNVRKLRKTALHALIRNKENRLLHDARMNNTKNISQRLNPKIMDEPEAHHVILNPENIHEKSVNRCSSFKQCLDNTLLYHQNWMDRSGSV